MGVKVKDIYYRSTLKAGAGIVGSFRYKDVFQIQSSKKTSSIFDGMYIDIEFNDRYRLNDGFEEKKIVWDKVTDILIYLKS
ncbi:hypothetical protein [Citrobacter freundii]|jgi:hypothetical protein|uniref:hypothetical protein n=1 Tax=Citrobacter freundii TaxID=546 RepID=UPI00388EDE56